MFKVFIIGEEYERVYICLEDKYNEILGALGENPSRVESVSVSMEALTSLLNGQMQYIMRDLK